MTDRKQALQDLLYKVEAGVKYETMGHTRMCQKAFPKPDDFDGSRESYSKSDAQQAILAWRNDSLDAARELYEAVLPEGILWDQSRSIFGYECSILLGDVQVNGCSKGGPARAWLIAILKVMIAQEDNA